MANLAMLHCDECGHTFKPDYSGIYDTHSCGEHASRNYHCIPDCNKCADQRVAERVAKRLQR